MSKTIIWIEDDSPVIEPLIEPLERAGHRILQFRTIQDSLDNIRLIKASDLILLDVFVPPGKASKPYDRYSGIQLLKELRDEHDITIPAVLLSVIQNSDLDEKLIGLNVQDCIRKPVLPSELKERVENVLETAET